MTKNGNNKPQQQQKRKADAPAQQAGPKKAKDASGAAAAPAAAAAAPKKQAQNAPKAKPAKKQPEPEPEEEDEEEEEEEAQGEPDEAKLAAAEAVQADMDKIMAELEELDEKQSIETFTVQKKYLLQKRPVLAKRDQLMAKVPGLWKTLMTEHDVFAVQLEDVDNEILDALTAVEVQEHFSAPSDPKQQLVSVDMIFTFAAGNKHVKAGKWTKSFKFDDETETLLCVPATKLPWVAPKFAESNGDSFFNTWFTSEGMDEGILRAQDALSSELYVDPLQLYKHVAAGGKLDDLHADEDDDEGLAMAFGEDSDDEEAPELADD